jgi:hypothetical protein
LYGGKSVKRPRTYKLFLRHVLVVGRCWLEKDAGDFGRMTGRRESGQNIKDRSEQVTFYMIGILEATAAPQESQHKMRSY